MFKIRESFDPSRLNGSQIIQICFGVNELMLHLHPDASIVIYDDITIIEPAQRHVVTDNYREAAGTIAPLVGDDIVDCSVFESSSLRIKLQSEYEIIVNGDSDQHECFEFKSEDLSFVV